VPLGSMDATPAKYWMVLYQIAQEISVSSTESHTANKKSTIIGKMMRV